MNEGKKIISYDLHGRTIDETIRIFNELLDNVRLAGEFKEYMFITGVGKLQNTLLQLAKDQELHHYILLSNRGCLVVEME